MNLNDPHLLEKLAAQEHERWGHWMAYLFTKGHALETGAFSIYPDSVFRWRRQAVTKYADLSEKEKESDRVEARKTLALLAAESAKHPVGCLLPDGHEGPCVEAQWEPETDTWISARPTPEWYLSVDADPLDEPTGFFWSVVREGSANEDGVTGYAPTVEAAKAKAEAVLRALLSVPGGL